MIRSIVTDSGLKISPAYHLTSRFPYLPGYPGSVTPVIVQESEGHNIKEFSASPSEIETAMQSIWPINWRPDPFYQDIHNDPQTKKSIVSYFYDRLKYRWLVNDFHELYKYLKVTESGVTYVDDVKSFDTNPDNRELKARFIIATIFDKIDMEALLDKYARKHERSWHDLKTKYHKDVKNYVYSKIRKHMENRVNRK